MFRVEKGGMVIRVAVDVWSPEQWAGLPEDERSGALIAGNGCYAKVRMA